MATKEQLKQAVCEAIDRHGNEIIELGETILHHPETGFNEGKTAAVVAEKMRELGLAPQTGLALTGVKGRLRGKSPGPRLAFRNASPRMYTGYSVPLIATSGYGEPSSYGNAACNTSIARSASFRVKWTDALIAGSQ